MQGEFFVWTLLRALHVTLAQPFDRIHRGVGFLCEHKGARSSRLDGVRDSCAVWTFMMWSDEQSLELIGLYQGKPEIWNPKNPDYFKKNLKNDAWSEIALSLGREVEECKNKIISLLASHRRERGKVKKSQGTGTGVDETYKSTWFAYEALAFLGDRNNPRKRLNTEVTAYSLSFWMKKRKKIHLTIRTLPRNFALF
ncbi:uncharacterized protein LOC106668474 [Cimex lectularius]|uniref:MADF domain-containing protein n=1 Tax=Cimex lectularius TaxID=79782 RepID=A0A8I6RW61_CIMLE|nr:uncharacterized protein LOC106668474 [Cimex lectularius]